MTRYQLFPALAPATEAALRASIQRFGVLVPVVKDQHGNLLDGHHRSRIADALGVDYQVTRVYAADEAEREAIIATLNVDRGHRVSADMRRLVVADLREKGHSMRAIAGAVGTSLGQIQRDLAGVSGDTPERTKGQDGKSYPSKRVLATVEKTADGMMGNLLSDPAVVEKVINGEARTAVEARRQVKKETLADAALSAPSGKYRVIYADPPWSYGNTQPDYHTEQRDHYPVLSIREICDLPVAALAEDDAVLFLWVTSPILAEAFSVIDAWGFTYKTSFVWDKVKHNMGHYNSVRHELLLVCTRGSCQPDVRQLFDSVVTEERTTHSTKPETFRQIIDTIYTHGKRMELFARRAAAGWDSWGLEAA